MDTKKIGKKIIGYAVKQSADEAVTVQKSEFKREQRDSGSAEVIRMHEKLERPETLVGSTYKVKTPVSDHAMYITINDIVLNKGTKYEKRRPFEIFINSKNLDHYQWIVALTRIISAVFRKGGDVCHGHALLRNDEDKLIDMVGTDAARCAHVMHPIVADAFRHSRDVLGWTPDKAHARR